MVATASDRERPRIVAPWGTQRARPTAHVPGRDSACGQEHRQPALDAGRCRPRVVVPQVRRPRDNECMEHTNENTAGEQSGREFAELHTPEVAERHLLVDLAVKAAEGGTFGAASGAAGYGVKQALGKVFGGHGSGSHDQAATTPTDASPHGDADPPLPADRV